MSMEFMDKMRMRIIVYECTTVRFCVRRAKYSGGELDGSEPPGIIPVSQLRVFEFCGRAGYDGVCKLRKYNN